MANLVILESPFKVPTVKAHLGSNYKVIACNGHVRDLPKSTLGVDIENDFEPHYINIRGKGDLIHEIRKEAKNANKIFLATDPDREGEAIAWHLAVALGIPVEKTLRVTFNELTKNVVKAGIKTPRQVNMDLVDAQQARRILDRIVGYKISPLLWKNVRSGLSAGRVQSVVTRLLVEREEEIRAFTPEEYWTVEVQLANDEGKVFTVRYRGDYDKNGNAKTVRLGDEAHAKAVADAAAKEPFVVRAVKTSTRTKMPAPPFTTSTLQQEASRRLGFQSQRTMRVAQELYEGINVGAENGGVQGLITYMRTDSQRISAEAQSAARELIENKYGAEYMPKTARQYKTRSDAQDAHEAIRPARVELEPQAIRRSLTPDQFKLYKLIWERFVSSQMQSATLSVLQVDLACGKHMFRAGGYTVTFPGYMALYEETVEETNVRHDADGEEKDAPIPALTEGMTLKTEGVNPEQHFTEPPARYNEGSLVKLMEEKGIGRPSTYATVITTILARNYVTREGKTLVPTPLGEVTTKMMKEYFPDVVDSGFTADMENDLDDIERGETSLKGVLHDFWGSFEKELAHAEKALGEQTLELPVEETDEVCEKCGSRMIVKNGRFGKFIACPNYPQCKNTKPLEAKNPATEVKEAKDDANGTVVPDMKCESCGADMVLRTGRYGSFYACSRYPECKFTKQKNKEVGVDCPKCGKPLVARYGRRRSFYGCSGYPECDFSSWDLPTTEKCPDCGEMLFFKKGKSALVCAKEGCGYSRPAPEYAEQKNEAEDEA